MFSPATVIVAAVCSSRYSRGPAACLLAQPVVAITAKIAAASNALRATGRCAAPLTGVGRLEVIPVAKAEEVPGCIFRTRAHIACTDFGPAFHFEREVLAPHFSPQGRRIHERRRAIALEPALVETQPWPDATALADRQLGADAEREHLCAVARLVLQAQ